MRRKEQGGLGFKDLTMLNLSLFAKKEWNLVCKPVQKS